MDWTRSSLLACVLLLTAASGCWGDSGDRQQHQAPAVHPHRAGVAAHQAPNRKHPSLRKNCVPDDARCVALRDHSCNPYFTNVSDVCTFVQYNVHCAEDVHHIAYLPLFYCRHDDGRVLVALFFLAWMGVLFWVMSKAAEDFLVPALEFLAQWMRMTPDVAGVTLFAFASGAPDLFTQIAAVAVGGNVDQELAISATLGGGLFIVAIIFSLVILVNRPPSGTAEDAGGITELTDRCAFIHDSLAYLLSTLALLGIMLRGIFSAWEAGLLLLGYLTYLAICLMTSRGTGDGHHGDQRHSYTAVSPSQGQQRQRQQQQLEMHQFGPPLYGADCGGTFSSSGGGAGGGIQLNGVVVASGDASLCQMELVPRSGSSQPLGRKPGDARSGSSTALAPLRSKLVLQQGGGRGKVETENELAVLVAGMVLSSDTLPAAVGCTTPPSVLTPRGGGGLRSAWRIKLGGHSSSRLGKALTSATLGLQEMLHTQGKSGPAMWLTMLMSPAVLLLHATMPALHPGFYMPWYALVLSLGAPLFMLLSTGLYPHHLGSDEFILTWLLAALALLALVLLAVPPAGATSGGGSSNSTLHQLLPGTLNGSAAVVAGPGGSPPAPAAPSSSSTHTAAPHGSIGSSRWSRGWANLTGCSDGRIQHLCGARRPRRNVVLALLASVQCMLWLSVAAEELVSLFQSIGRICDISQDLLGATVLAWGEAVPELVATTTLAKQGQATTAISAVFGGPVFNILCAWAAPTLYAALRKDSPPYHMSSGVAVLVTSTVVVLAFSLVAIPLMFGWRLARRAAVAILLIYGVSQVLFLLAEELH